MKTTFLLPLLVLTLTACGGSEAEPTPEPVYRGCTMVVTESAVVATVTDAAGTPLPNPSMRYTYGSGPLVPGECSAGVCRTYAPSFEGVGRFTLQFEHAGFEPATVVVDVQPRDECASPRVEHIVVVLQRKA